MARRTRAAVEAAAAQASEAARTLAARSHEARAERTEPAPEPKEDAPRSTDPSRMEKLLAARTHPQAMDAIIAKREALEPQEEEPKVEEKPAEAPKEEVKVEAPPTEEKPAEAPAEAVEAPPAPKVKVKVDGEEFEVDQAEIDEAGGIKAYQKDRAAQNRLAKAHEANRKTQEQLAQVAQMLLRQNAPKPEPRKSSIEIAKEKIDLIRFGTHEESTAALMEVIQSAVPQQVDQNAMLNHLMAAVSQKQAADEFGKQFPAVVTNPLLVKLAVQIEREEIANADRERRPIDWRNLYGRIGNQLQSFVPRSNPSPQQSSKTESTPSSASEREARKASNITTIPTAAARAALPAEEKELTPEEERKAFIAGEKKKRGQA